MGNRTLKPTMPPLIIPGSRAYYAMIYKRMAEIKARQEHIDRIQRRLAALGIALIVLVSVLYIGIRI